MKRLTSCFLFLALLALAAVAPSSSQAQEKKALTIEAIFADGGLTGRGPEDIKWSPDSSRVSYVQRDDSGDHGELWYVDAATGEKKVLVSETRLASLAPSSDKIKNEREKERVQRYHVAAYQWAPDSKHLLFDSQGQLWLFDLNSNTAVQFTSEADPTNDPKFSPDGSRVAYGRNHNLYVRPASGGGEKQLTKDKDENLLNGEVDWLYAEELSVRGNYFWSPDSKQIVYLQTDETKVPTYPIVDWIPTHPHADLEKYPKAGDTNPTVRLGVVDASGGKTKWISLGEDPDVYVPRFGWVNENVLWAQVLNRAQNKVDVYFVDAHSGKSRVVLSDSSPDSWLYVRDDMKVLKSGDRFLWSSWRDGNTHLYLYSFSKQDPLAADAKLEHQLTQGDFEMMGVQAVDETAGLAYVACDKDDPRQQQIYAVKLDGSGMQRVSKETGTHFANFADDGKHYLDNYSAQITPPSVSMCDGSGACKSVWQSRSVDGYGLTPLKFLEFKADDGTTLYGDLLLPPNASASDKIPLIVEVYGGPAGQTVTNSWIGWGGLFHQRMAQKGYAIFSVDNRATPNRGRKFETAAIKQFGGVELKDQLAALEQLLAQYPQLDRSRVGMWGWSNGASMTLYAMTHSEAFKAGVAVSPVSDFRNYDTTYTERFMGLPKDNQKGYDEMSLPKVADKLHGALLLCHGTSDDNVHFQNSIQMVDALINAGKQFRFMAYPGKTHGISGKEARTQLFHMMEDHWDRELK